jgi:hypothetical protein
MPTKLDQSNVNGKTKKRMNRIEKSDNPWDSAINEARRRIADLRFSIREFKKRKERGDKWLGAA